MSNATAREAYWQTKSRGAGKYSQEQDLLHRHLTAHCTEEVLTESQYFSLCLPEHRIHGALCCYWYPNIGQVCGGVWVWQGFKRHHLACEIFDWRSHMSDHRLHGDLWDYTLTMGYRMQMEQPGKRFHAFYEDPARQNKLDIVYTAIMEPFVLGSQDHLEQHMKAEGELVLRGTKYPFSGYSVRNRSWGQVRSEESRPTVPATYISGVFSERCSFYCSMFDDPKDHPEWEGTFLRPIDTCLVNGFFRRDGNLLELVDGHKYLVRNRDTLWPEAIQLHLVDIAGNEYHIQGSFRAASSFGMWYNMEVAVCQTRWEWGDLVGYGDTQDIKLGDFMFFNMNR